jgi:hypothetical protein
LLLEEDEIMAIQIARQTMSHDLTATQLKALNFVQDNSARLAAIAYVVLIACVMPQPVLILLLFALTAIQQC